MKVCHLIQVVAIFAALCVVGICLVAVSSLVPKVEDVLSVLDRTLSGSGLAFFLVKLV
jgi:hypothetical protein